ncbi:MAG: hypothetical protein HOP15_00635 [Planctomycetes bacterium]|nr:hypothetical protein [Planctomycetota bacterium]
MTDESPELVLDWIAKAKPSYPIALTRGAFENQIKVPHFPYCAVIGPDGNIAYAGNKGGEEGALENAFASAKKEPFWPKSLAKLTKLMTGDPIKAYGELKKLTEGGKVSETDKAYVDGFVAYLEERANVALADARSFREKGHVFKAVRKIEAYSTAQPPFPASADSAALLKELQALPDFKKEFGGGEAYAAAEAFEKDREFLDAFESFKSVAKKFAGTKVAENAKVQAERLRSEGLPGYEPACESCGKGKRACTKHKKEVKL